MMLPATSDVKKPSTSKIKDDATFCASSGHRAGNTANTFSGLGMSTGCVSFRSVETTSHTMSRSQRAMAMWQVDCLRARAGR